MVIKLDDIAEWALWKSGEVLELRSPKLRKVRLEVNCPQPTAFHARPAWDHESPFFLAVVHGKEVIEFTVQGDVSIHATSEDEVWFYTSELEVTWTERPEDETFTKIASRRARNPELEYMQYVMRENERRRDAALATDREMMAEAMRKMGFDPQTGEALENENGDGAADGTAGANAPAPGGEQSALEAEGEDDGKAVKAAVRPAPGK